MVRSVTVGSVRETAADNPTYYNILTQKVLSKRELGAKTFVVEDSIQPLNWKITEDHKTILEHPAKKALAKRITYRLVTVMENGEVKQHKEADTSNITAWYALDLPVSAGPEVSGLPGLILELDINQGFMVYTAVQITDKVRPGSLKEPKGKRISVEEFEKEKNRVMQEIRKRGSNDPEVKGASN
jgi:GLPGLI family protein